MSFQDEAGWSGYPDARAQTLGDLWDSGGSLSQEHQSSSAGGTAHVVNAPNGLWLRSSPMVAADNGITRMPNDSQLVFYEDMQNGWWKVEFYGNVGFASKQYLELGPSRAGRGDAPIPPYVEPSPPSPVINVDPPAPPPAPVEEPKKSKALWYVLGAAAIAGGYYFL